MTMLDIKYVRNNLAEITEKLKFRGEDLSDFNQFSELDERRRTIIKEVENLKARRNETSKQISQLKRDKRDATDLIQEMQQVGKDIKEYDTELDEVETKLENLML